MGEGDESESNDKTWLYSSCTTERIPRLTSVGWSSQRVTAPGPARMRFLAVSMPTPLSPTIST